MKTININLLGSLGKNPAKARIEKISIKSKNDLDPKTKTISMILVSASLAVFLISLGLWSIMFFNTKNIEFDLENLTAEVSQLSPQLKTMDMQKKEALKNKKILELKLTAKKQLNKSFLSWHEILIDISKAVPQNLKITEISHRISSKNQGSSSAQIKGQVNSNYKNALKLIAYFALNINEMLPENSYLQDAVITNIRFNESTDLYDFEILATINKPEIPQKKDERSIEKSILKTQAENSSKKKQPSADNSKTAKISNNQLLPISALAVPSTLKQNIN